jgi:hypothetical protein
MVGGHLLEVDHQVKPRNEAIKRRDSCCVNLPVCFDSFIMSSPLQKPPVRIRRKRRVRTIVVPPMKASVRRRLEKDEQRLHVDISVHARTAIVADCNPREGKNGRAMGSAVPSCRRAREK